jgi:hypothetical protein
MVILGLLLPDPSMLKLLTYSRVYGEAKLRVLLHPLQLQIQFQIRFQIQPQPQRTLQLRQEKR